MDWVLMAEIGSPHGLRGWVRLNSYTSPLPALTNYCQFQCDQLSDPLKVRSYGQSGRHLIASFENCNDRDAAEQLRGKQLKVHSSALPETAPGEYYWHQLIGLEVHTHAGKALGYVSHLLPTARHDVLAVKDGDNEQLIPWLPAPLNIEVNLEAHRLCLDWEAEY